MSLLIAMLPSFFICWMIYTTDGLDSPYYAGLNLVLLSIALVMRWTVTLSIAASLSVISMYLAACFFRGTITQEHGGDFVNNLYFLALTAVIVIIGGHLHRVLRLREFTLRYELDRNRTALEESNRKLIELDRLKSRFFANISHEMRTPLALLLSPLETLLQRYHHHLDDSVREKLVMMQSNGMRLLKLINDLLELIRLEAGRLEIKSEPLAVNEFVAGLASAIRQLAENKRIHVETRVAKDVAAVLTDRDKLEKILLNLLFNSLKFTPEKGTVSLRAERQGDQFVLIVSDTGVGIAEKNLPFVFDRFWQADTSSKRKFQGVGIGLALVKELSEMMGGGVTVQSQEGKGAAFTVKLPYRAAELPAKREIPEPVPAADGAEHTEEWLANLYRRAEFFPALAAGRATSRISAATGSRPVVLIADDEPDMRNYLRTELEEDYDVIEAVNGTEAFEKAEQFRPDIALLDVMMPEMDGLEVCRKMRERENTVNIPVILLTARADEETKFDALQIGANDFLPKPFSSNELQARVRNLIETHYYHRKLTKQNVALKSAIEQIKETETQLVQSEKLASLGRLSAGIIHEINNPLNFSLTGLYTLRNKGKKMQMTGKEREEYEAVLNDVEEGLKRVRNIVSDLRAFTHPGGAIGEPLEAADAVNAALRFLSGEWKNKVHIEQNVPPEQLIWANRNQVIHVLVNLIQNSIDALAEKKFEGDEKPTIYISGCVEGERSLIFVRDNGAGIDPKIADKIFDPFFTTKEVGKGMGLGLSICYRIMHGYGGNISVKTEQGRFTEFALNFWLKAPPEVALDTEIENGQPLRL
ncbi:MAG TPA: ATP-binding protein [Verrucomicrobiae bacterium]|nr:ATP-binding protein [Verrucomicrobiae bacterium]